MSKDDLGDRMKMYEKLGTPSRFTPLLPVMARLDGRSFSKYTKGFARPYDTRMSSCMAAVTLWLVEETGAKLGYTQSDEITLMFYSDKLDKQIFFDGKIQKILSVLAAMCSVKFYQLSCIAIPERKDWVPQFDCRIWSVPSLIEAANAFVWRENDATKNSVQMLARCHFSHNELNGKGRADQMDMLMSKGINWNDEPAFFKRGTYFKRVEKLLKFTTEELDRLPEKHAARTNPDLEVMRSCVEELELPPILKIENRVETLFK